MQFQRGRSPVRTGVWFLGNHHVAKYRIDDNMTVWMASSKFETGDPRHVEKKEQATLAMLKKSGFMRASPCRKRCLAQVVDHMRAFHFWPMLMHPGRPVLPALSVVGLIGTLQHAMR